MSDSVESISFEVTGDDAVEQVRRMLEQFDDATGFDHARVFLGERAAGVMGEQRRGNPPYDSDPVGQANRTQRNRVNSGTSHHTILSALSEIAEDRPATTKDVLDVVELKDGTAYAAMSELFDRGLVTRAADRNEDNSFEYTLSPDGRAELDRLGGTE